MAQITTQSKWNRQKNDYAYDKWIEQNEKENTAVSLENRPWFSFLVPVSSGSSKNDYEEFLESVRKQTYRNWEICYGNDVSSALEKAKGTFISFADSDMILSPDALYETAKFLDKNKNLDFIYSDEDMLLKQKRCAPYFKPDWSPDTFFSFPYALHFAVYRKKTVCEISDAGEINGINRTKKFCGSEYKKTWVYDFTMRFTEHCGNRRVGHLPKILCHYKNGNAFELGKINQKRIKQDALKRRGYKGKLEYVNGLSQYRVIYEAPKQAKVSIIILSKDHLGLLKQCVNSIKKYTADMDYEIIVVDNGSEENNRREAETFLLENHAVYHYQPMDFNFSRMCNLGAELASGDFFLFLNDDIQVARSGWLRTMVGHAALPHVGAVGAKLIYPESDLLQHIGVTNLKTGPSHSYLGTSDKEICYFGKNRLDYNVLAVTAACLVISAKKFWEAGGFDENLGTAYNDVDLCFTLHEAGLYQVIRNDVCLYHYESASRGLDERDEKKKQRMLAEKEYLYRKHESLRGKDPFYSPNLNQEKEDYSLNVKNAVRVFPCLGDLSEKNVEETDFMVSIDCVKWEEDVYIQGWFFWEQDMISNRCDAAIVLRDKSGRRICYETEKQFRRDVSGALKNMAFHTGFVCGISGADLDLKKKDYQIGVLLMPPHSRKKLLCWTDRTVGSSV